MKVLFVMEKYIFWDQKRFGLTNNMYNLIGCWESANLGPYETAFISTDEGDIWSEEVMDRVLLERDYDVAVISPYQGPHGCINCSYEVAERLGNKLLFCWWDCVAFPKDGEFVHPETRTPGWRWWEYANRGCQNLIMDHGKGEIYKNSYGVDVPQDDRVFYKNTTLSEDLDISFIGAFHTRGDRMHVVNIIRRAGFNVWVGGGRGHESQHDNYSVLDYASIHHRSKICLNLQYGHGKPQRKGRSFELASCGKFMMANYPEMFSGKDGNFFEDGVDYISFHDGDLVDKIRYFLSHEEERKKIADNIYKKYRDNYAPVHFWTRALGYCGHKVSQGLL